MPDAQEFRAAPETPKGRFCCHPHGLSAAGLWAICRKRCVNALPPEAVRAPGRQVRPKAACGLWRGGGPKPGDRPWSPSVRGNRGVVCAPARWAGRCVSPDILHRSAALHRNSADASGRQAAASGPIFSRGAAARPTPESVSRDIRMGRAPGQHGRAAAGGDESARLPELTRRPMHRNPPRHVAPAGAMRSCRVPPRRFTLYTVGSPPGTLCSTLSLQPDAAVP